MGNGAKFTARRIGSSGRAPSNGILTLSLERVRGATDIGLPLMANLNERRRQEDPIHELSKVRTSIQPMEVEMAGGRDLSNLLAT